MTSRAKWVRATVVGLLIALIVGRWLAVSTANALWADAVGVGATHREIRELQAWLLVVAFSTAAIWFTVNLYLVYRSIGSVHVPRKVGNLEILEAVPRQYLLVGAVTLGVALAVAVSHRAEEWWYPMALAGVDRILDLRDPILGRDAGYYLFHLPWQRVLHTFTTILTVVGVVMIGLLYTAVGAVRWSRRRLRIADLARFHLAGLFAALALTLFWGYRLEPAEYVAGIHSVPLDTVLINVRLPVARVLSAIALVVCGTSLFWVWVPRALLIGVSWGLLGVASLVGHYLAPAFAGAVRPRQELAIPGLGEPIDRMTSTAYGVDPGLAMAVLGWGPGASAPDLGRQLRATPVWDDFAVAVFIDRAANIEPHLRFTEPALAVYRGPGGEPVPVFLAARRIDLDRAREAGAELTWAGVHVSPYSSASGAVAIAASRVSPSGLPLFIKRLDRPDSVIPEVTDLELERPEILFAPELGDFAVVGPGGGVVGVSVGGLARRLALAWVLQSPRLLRFSQIADTALVVWSRDVARRLERLAPFATFERPYPVVEGGMVRWLAAGLVDAAGFPGTPDVTWRGRRVRYLRASLVGVVDAATGESAVYLARHTDPLTAAWAELVPEVVRPFDDMPRDLRQHMRYSVESFETQRRVVQLSWGGRVTPRSGASGAATSIENLGSEATWWVGAVPWDSTERLRMISVEETGSPAIMSRIVSGTVRDGAPEFTVVSLDTALVIAGPSQVVRRFIQVRDATAETHGPLRVAPIPAGPVVLQSSYFAPDEDGAVPELRGVTVARGAAIGTGRTLAEATARLDMEAPAPPRAGAWDEARRWFQRMDAARQSGDWQVFGEAYNALRRLLASPRDTTR